MATGWEIATRLRCQKLTPACLQTVGCVCVSIKTSENGNHGDLPAILPSPHIRTNSHIFTNEMNSQKFRSLNMDGKNVKLQIVRTTALPAIPPRT